MVTERFLKKFFFTYQELFFKVNKLYIIKLKITVLLSYNKVVQTINKKQNTQVKYVVNWVVINASE